MRAPGSSARARRSASTEASRSPPNRSAVTRPEKSSGSSGHFLAWRSSRRTASSERLSLYERGKPFRVLLSVWLHDRGVQVVHAALVARGDRGVLLPGRGGAGKTTSALTCLLAGFRYLGDDYVGLEGPVDGSFRGHSLSPPMMTAVAASRMNDAELVRGVDPS